MVELNFLPDRLNPLKHKANPPASKMPFRYKHVLMVGATSGIGAAIANRLVQEGSKVTAVGRRQDKLDEFVHRHGKDKASAIKFDISDRQSMDEFVKMSVPPFCPRSRFRENLTAAEASHTPTLTSTASS